MGIFILLLPSDTFPEECEEIAKHVEKVMKDKDDTILVLVNNINQYQLLSAGHYSNAQMQRKIDKLTSLFTKTKAKNFKFPR
jgi:hypothetical protein